MTEKSKISGESDKNWNFGELFRDGTVRRFCDANRIIFCRFAFETIFKML